nr:retrovirus-related Pol polyprotein from transposon TNT 1-94 [Tanacetum cinerariifolium]
MNNSTDMNDINSTHHPLYFHPNDHPESALWNELSEHYSQLDRHRIYQLANEIVDLKQSNCTIEIYNHKLKGLWDELDAIEAPYTCTCKCVCVNGKENGEMEHRKRLDHDGKATHGTLHGGLYLLPTISSISPPTIINSYSNNLHGAIKRYKARIVAKGFNQKEGIDYTETFAQVSKMVTVRTLLNIVVQSGWIIEQMDVHNAFLHGDLNEDVYMQIP